jgi:hypothetical protein
MDASNLLSSITEEKCVMQRFNWGHHFRAKNSGCSSLVKLPLPVLHWFLKME